MAYGNGSNYDGPTMGPGARGLGEIAALNAPSVSRVPMVAAQMETAAKHIEGLHGLLTDLEQRLSCAVHAEPPAATATKGDRPHPGVPLVGALMELNARIELACARVASLNQRLEL